jgi:four helix bundle protein
MINSYKELIVWQKSAELSVLIYILTKKFPKEETYGIISQMRRSAISIPSNIAEGRYRGTKKDFVQFLRIAFGSGAELETQIFIAKQIYNNPDIDFSKVDSLLNEVMRMLNAMIKNINPKS